MNNFYALWRSIFIYVFLFFSLTTFAQVGIGTTNPNGNALLELDASATPGGLLLPRVELVRTTDPTPLTAPVEAGMAVYNTANQNDVTKGYYYHNGTVWVRIAASSDASDDWKLTGNAGTVPDDNFIGTTDNQPFRVRTDNQVRFEFTNNGRLRSFHNGGPGQPTYSWIGRANTGMWSQADNVISFSTNGTEKFRIPNAEQVHAMGNGTAAAPFYSWSSDTDTGIYRVGANSLGFSTNGSEKFRIPNAEQVHAMGNGTAAAPFYSWSLDPNTGMYRIADNTLGFSTNGGERVRITENGNVGIGSANPSERLEVTGNLRLTGALMPGNQSGTTGRVLSSAGANTSPTWGAEMGNINQIRRFITEAMTVEPNTTYEVVFPVAGLTNNSSAIVNLSGDWTTSPSDDITIQHVEARNGEVRFIVTNNSGGGIFGGGGTIYYGMDFTITIIR